ncbi:MAG: hypothetical protein PUC65_03460 [Clostridiales bacterium]|nr:hypothetical protein [Clostridiales bacterium]
MNMITLEKDSIRKSVRFIENIFIISMILVLVSTYGAIQVFTDYEGIIIGAFLFLLAIPSYFMGKKGKIPYWITIGMNSVACGLVISSYFLVKNQTFDLTSLLAMSVCCVVMWVSMELLYQMKSHPQLAYLLCWIFNISLIIACTITWNQLGYCFSQYSFFLLIQICVYLLILRKRDTVPLNLRKTMSFASFGIFLVVLIAALTILSEGDALDFLDFGFDSKEPKLSKKKRKRGMTV